MGEQVLVFGIGLGHNFLDDLDGLVRLLGGRQAAGLAELGRQPLRLAPRAFQLMAQHVVENLQGLDRLSLGQEGPAGADRGAHLVVFQGALASSS